LGEGNLGNSSDLGRQINVGINPAPFSAWQRLDASGFAEVRPTQELAHNHDIDTLQHRWAQR
jgi:hypothetical protein